MKVKFEEILQAFDFVSFGSYGLHSALLDRSTGQIHLYSEVGLVDEISEELLESDDVIDIPHKNDLDLGTQLVYDFVLLYNPQDYDVVRRIFCKRGAYSRYKSLLESRGLLDKWYDFEQKEQEKRLREWCELNQIELTD